MSNDPGGPLGRDGRAPSAAAPAVAAAPSAAATGVMLALARAARSFTLYAADNETVRTLIGNYREKMNAVLEQHGALDVTVSPFELLVAGKAVYADEDREKSLAFRLFRDGVRRFVIRPGVPWEELLRFLEVFSLRYVGVRQQEDDMVTLLRKQQLQSITIEAVEGFLPDEEDPEGVTEHQVRPRGSVAAPEGWDEPLPAPTRTVEVLHRAIPPDYLELLRAEESEQEQPRCAVVALRQLIALRGQSADPITPAEILGFAKDVGAFLMVEGRADLLLVLARDLRAAFPDEPEAAEVVRGITGAQALERFLRDVGSEQESALVELVALQPGDHLQRALQMLCEDPGDERRRMLQTLVARLAAGDPERLIARLADAPPALAAELFEILSRAAPERTVDAALSAASQANEALQLAVLGVLQGAPSSAALARALRGLLGADFEPVRVRAAEVFAARGGTRAFEPLRAALEARAKGGGVEAREAGAFGVAIARAGGEQALALFGRWTAGGGVGRLLRKVRVSPAQGTLRWAAVAGLAELGGTRARDMVEALLARADEELAAHCRSALASMSEGAS